MPALLVVAAVGLVTSPGPAAGADGTTDVTDGTGTFTLSVPASWTDVLPQPLEQADGSLTPGLTVAPDVGGYLDSTGEGADLLVVSGPSTPDIYTQEYLDAFVLAPDCVIASPATASSSPAQPRTIVGTWGCGGLTLTISWGATADDAYVVAASALTTDPAVGAAVVGSLQYRGSGGGPPTTLATETEGLTVSDPGDPATAVVLRRPRTVGARSNVVTETATSGSEVYVPDAGETESTQFNSTFRSSGTYEVTAEQPDGAYAVRFTPDTITGDYTSSDPATSFTGGFAPLVGFPMETWYGADGLPIGFIEAEGSTPTDEQSDWIRLIPLDGFSLPVTPVGVGATWTADVDIFVEPWFLARVPATYHLDAIEGDRFSVSMSLTVDAATLPGDEFTDSMSGTYSRTVWLAGSVSQPGIEMVLEETATLHGEFWYGSSDVTWNSRRTFNETLVPAG